MELRAIRRAAVPVACLLLAGFGCSERVPDIAIENAWARPTLAAGAAPPEGDLPGGPGVMYLTLANRGRAADRLLGVSTTVCDEVEIHETIRDGDAMRMVPLENGVSVPSRGRVELRPGGQHVMLLGLRRHLQRGDRFDARLRFELSGELAVSVEVRTR